MQLRIARLKNTLYELTHPLVLGLGVHVLLCVVAEQMRSDRIAACIQVYIYIDSSQKLLLKHKQVLYNEST